MLLRASTAGGSSTEFPKGFDSFGVGIVKISPYFKKNIEEKICSRCYPIPKSGLPLPH